MTALDVRRQLSPPVRAGTLLIGFAAAVALRIAVGGVAVRDSAGAGLAFAAALTALAAATGLRTRLDVRSLIAGAAGAGVMCAPLVLRGDLGTHRPAGSYAVWAVVVVVVALAEEAFLRGALFDALLESAGPWTAVCVGALCFAALHVPMYGWASAPLDVAVGLLLGAVRWASGSWIAPGISHAAADLATWWLR